MITKQVKFIVFQRIFVHLETHLEITPEKLKEYSNSSLLDICEKLNLELDADTKDSNPKLRKLIWDHLFALVATIPKTESEKKEKQRSGRKRGTIATIVISGCNIETIRSFFKKKSHQCILIAKYLCDNFQIGQELSIEDVSKQLYDNGVIETVQAQERVLKYYIPQLKAAGIIE